MAIVSVSAFVSILLDQMLERAAYVGKLHALENAALLARDRIKDFETLPAIEKVWRVLASFASHYITNFEEMSAHNRSTTTAQLAAFVERVAPELTVEQEVRFISNDQSVVFDMVISDGDTKVAVETREPRSRDRIDANFGSDAALSQLEKYLRLAGLSNGVLFFLPGDPNEVPIATTGSSSWPKDLNLREVYGEDEHEVERWQTDEEAISLVNEQG